MLRVKVYSANSTALASITSVVHFNTHETLISGIGHNSLHSDYESRRRAFQRGSMIIYLNREKLNTFITLTYRIQTMDSKQVLNDLKNCFSRRGISYLAVIEKHKSGFYHIHAITSQLPGVVSLRKKKYSWSFWKKGFSDVKFLKDCDSKFRVEKYIFKYMMKSERIGGRFFYKSRDLTLPPESTLDVVKNMILERCDKNLYNVDGIKVYSERRYYGQNPS